MAALLFAWGTGCGRRRPQTAPGATDTAETQMVSTTDARGSEGYLPNERCATCHEQIATSYQAHSMGRSLMPLSDGFRLPTTSPAEFEADGFRYSVVRQGGRWFHRQARITSEGAEMAVELQEVSHVVGSGNHGQSFLVARDGYLFMSPITWYPDKQLWQLSPGFEETNSQFHRPIVEICLYCHSNGVERIEDTLNQYAQPVFREAAIGCQRCHGPAAAHVRYHESGGSEGEDSIVNPARLAPALREAVCQQCHLSGVARVKKPGKRLHDYRPGEPLHSTYTVFTQSTSGSQFVGHVEQMYQSKCFQGSDQQLGCTSCHDPHRLPTPAEHTAYYRDRCLECHGDQSCALTLAARKQTTAEDSCIVCHMPHRQTEVRHAASTDHSIPRQPDQTAKPLGERASLVSAFPSEEVAKPTARDTAIALLRAGSGAANQRDMDLAASRDVLAAVVREDVGDVDAAEALVDLYVRLGAISMAVKQCQTTLEQHPRRERTLTMMADIYRQLDRPAQALPFWKRAIDVNPHMPRYWYQLGQAYANTNQWYVCRQTMQEAKQRFPTSIGVRQLLVESNWRLADPESAAAEFHEIERFAPDGLGALRDWYESLTANR